MTSQDTGWARLGLNRYHYYDAGQSLCSYHRQPGELQWAVEEAQAHDRCTSCVLHLKKRRELAKLVSNLDTARRQPAPGGRVYALDLDRAHALHQQYGGAVIVEQEDLMRVLDYGTFKPFVREDKQRGAGLLMLPALFHLVPTPGNLEGFASAELALLWRSGLIRFGQAPQVRVGRVRFPCGKEVVAA